MKVVPTALLLFRADKSGRPTSVSFIMSWMRRNQTGTGSGSREKERERDFSRVIMGVKKVQLVVLSGLNALVVQIPSSPTAHSFG